jgi:hypothetical protein
MNFNDLCLLDQLLDTIGKQLPAPTIVGKNQRTNSRPSWANAARGRLSNCNARVIGNSCQ